jgi:TRAP transporter 4TM/12TM fusion protein
MEHLTKVLPIELILGTIAVIVLIEGIRRAVAPGMSVLIGIFIIYLLSGPYLPGVLKFHPISYERAIEKFYLLANEGIFGFITGISATYIAIFIIFGAFINATGVGKLFIDLANSIAGRSIGGPAKVSTISSGLFATISGTNTGNVFATGTFTIPLMKSLGYDPIFAASVEAVASSGGMIMPPIMGATVFIMSEMLGIPYIKLCIAAFIPATLYYFSLIFFLHFQAVKSNLKGLPKEKIIPWKILLKDFHLLLPIFVIIYFLMGGFSPMLAAFYGIISSLLVSMVKKKNKISFIKFWETLETGGRNMIIVALACAGAGIMVSVIGHSGLGLTISSGIIALSKGKLIIALILIAITSIVLSMGLPATPAYVITIAVGGVALSKLGADPLATHLFVYYYAILAGVTPPVCMCAYAAASIAGSNPMKTGYASFKLSTFCYLIPFLFFYDHSLLAQGTYLEIVFGIIKGIAVGILIPSSIVGNLGKNIKLSVYERNLFFIISFIIVFPFLNLTQSLLTLCRFLLIIFLVFVYIVRNQKQKRIAQ